MTYPFRLPIVGNISANGQTVFADIAGSPNVAISATGTFSNHNIVFEVSYDSTNGTNGNWVQVAATRTTKAVAETTTGTFSAAPTYGWVVPTLGAQYVRVRAIAYTSGTSIWNLQPCAEMYGFCAEPSANVGSGSAVLGSPTRGAARARNTITTVTNDQVVDLIANLNGSLIVQLNSIPELTWQNTATLTTTADAVVKAAAGAGVRNYVTDISFQNTNATITGIVIKDGATDIARFNAPANMAVPAVITFSTPLRGTANTALNVAALVTGANVLVNTAGFTGA